MSGIRSLSTLARVALHDATLKGNARANATPYLQALIECEQSTDDFHLDSAEDLVIYALSNLQYWRGPNARVVKAELREHLPYRCKWAIRD